MAATLRNHRGGLALRGPMIDDAGREFGAHIRDSTGTPYHITLLTKEEYRSKIQTTPTIPVDHLYFLGLGGAEGSGVYWVVCTWAAGAAWRKTLNLPPKDFHITLTSNDVHSVAKDASSLLNPSELVAAFPSFPPEKQDNVLHHLHSIRSDLTLPLAIPRAIANPGAAKDFLRVGDASLGVNPKLSMLAYQRALLLDPSSQRYVERRLRKLSALTQYGPMMTAAERETIACDILMEPWCAEAREIGHHLYPLEAPPAALAVDSRERLWCGDYEFPRFFSWIVPFFLAGMSTPRNERDVDALADLGINRVLTLTKEEPLPTAWFRYKAVQNVFLPVENYKAPTFKEVDYFLDAVNEDETVWLVHCGAGKGRAGTFLACYIAMHGFQKPAAASSGAKPVLDGGTVIRWLRAIRPGSIETAEQERFVASWISYRWKSKADELPEPIGAMRVEGRLLERAALILLVGLPGSGKSWLSAALAKRVGAEVVSQDDSGSRDACERAISRCRSGKTAILDRCNASRDERRQWLALADVGESAVAVYFDVDATICTQRINRRIHHPTIRPGRSDNAMAQMQRLMSKPSRDEGFAAVVTVPSFPAARDAVHALGGTPPLRKFPRTPHLIDLGAATGDDLVAPSFRSSTPFVVVEEKVDGANFGISLDCNETLVVQNRSHTVNSLSHAQFRPLDAWLRTHGPALRALLLRDAQFPERYILYGEWLVATHSIAYLTLPDIFLAFDFYDRVTDTFASRDALSRLLHNTGIHQVPLVWRSVQGVTRNELVAMASRKSAFYDGPVEGVYVRFEDPERMVTVDRGKVVRVDFIAGNEHWNKGGLRLNAITECS